METHNKEQYEIEGIVFIRDEDDPKWGKRWKVMPGDYESCGTVDLSDGFGVFTFHPDFSFYPFDSHLLRAIATFLDQRDSE